MRKKPKFKIGQHVLFDHMFGRYTGKIIKIYYHKCIGYAYDVISENCPENNEWYFAEYFLSKK